MRQAVIRIHLLILLVVISNYHCPAQDNEPDNKPQHFSFTGTFGYGTVLQTTPFVKGDNLQGHAINDYQFYSLKALWQNPGYTHWQQVYRSPYYGFGISYGNFFNRGEIGNPVSGYGILGIPVLRWKGFSSYSEFQFGMATNWRKYNPVSNPKNHVIGGVLTIHLDLALKAYLALGKNFETGTGISFIHFSNGGFERPNRGFNIYSPTVELKYRFKQRPDYREIPKAKPSKRTNDLLILANYGDYQIVEHETDSNYFAFAGLSLIYYTQLSEAFRLGSGTDINYWWGLNANPDGTYAGYSYENITLGLILQPELIVNKLSLVAGVGIYARHRNYGNFKQFYQRLGVRFEVLRNAIVGVNVRAINFMLAECLEFNFGYKFSWQKK
ncbi:MAG: acyloxyacyl hydrolase [Prolixibacteraceae bacterium]|nr:acyloxyacyl hydrolase [Prolixibacteraceae bacterium]